jgi:hypothetical protein
MRSASYVLHRISCSKQGNEAVIQIALVRGLAHYVTTAADDRRMASAGKLRIAVNVPVLCSYTITTIVHKVPRLV